MKIEQIYSLKDILKFYKQIIDSKNEVIIIDFQDSTYIRNHYISILEQALEIKKLENKMIKVVEPLSMKIKKDLSNIGFLSKYSNKKNEIIADDNMIKLINIEKEDEQFDDFLLNTMHQLGNNINNLSYKISQKILELFNNVFRHSKSKLGFFCSGQLDDKQKIINFTIVDSGITIKTNINRYFEDLKKDNKKILDFSKFNELNGYDAIKWALENGNSTTGKGGFGLNLLQELILKSGGRLEIISNDGYFYINNGIIREQKLDYDFEGTIVSIGLSTDINRLCIIKGDNNDKN